jgi:membrane protein implicated in regulation of membrane protease activity
MLTVYIICAIVGGGLILVTAFTGGGDHDAGHDIGHDADVGHDVSHDSGHDGADGPWLPFFSVRFWTYLIGVFGSVGLLLTLLSDSREPTTALLSAGTGLLSGLVAATLVRWLSTHESDSTAREADFLGQRARVTVPIRENQLGRIRTTVKGELLDILATAEEPKALAEGSEVVIIGMENGRATVMPLDTLLEETT